MKNEELRKMHEKFQTVAIAVSLLFTLGGVGVGLLNYYVLTQLQPIQLHLTSVDKAFADYKSQQQVILSSLATKQQVNDLTSTVGTIQKEVLFIYQKDFQ